MTRKKKVAYDKNYYEKGVEKGISGYTDYHWRPEYVLPFANQLKKHFHLYGRTALDFGCAKGYLVKALRMLRVAAYGFDLSDYAISNCHPDVVDYVSCNDLKDIGYELIIAKDVLEHIPEVDLQSALKDLHKVAGNWMIVTVPLGDGKKYRIREYELDKTHVIRQDEVWWEKQFDLAHWSLQEFYYDYPGCKQHWLTVHPHGNGTFVLRKV
jgi:hypothetical protein